VAVVSPGLTETDVSKADGAPGEEGSKTRQVEQPGEDDLTGGDKVHVGESTPNEDEDDGPERTARLVDVGEDLGSVTLISKRSQGTRATVDTRHTNGDDGDENDNVHEAVETDQTSILGSNDERRGVGAAATEQTLVVRANEKTNEGKTKDVEQGDTPENLSDGTRERLQRVGSLGSSQTDQLGSGERESSSDEDGAETLEAVVESTRVVPETGAPVLVVDTTAGTSTKNQDKGDDHEDDGGRELQARRPEFFLGITEYSENVNDDDEDPENGHPD